jgi:hypothetical protein
MNRINEIGNTKKGQEMLGRTAERAYQRAQRTSGADKKRYEKTFSDAYRTGGKSANKHLGGSREHFDNGRDYEHEKWEKEHNGNVAESKNMNKKLIRLTESDLHRIVKESVNRILIETNGGYNQFSDADFASDGDPYGFFDDEDADENELLNLSGLYMLNGRKSLVTDNGSNSYISYGGKRIEGLKAVDVLERVKDILRAKKQYEDSDKAKALARVLFETNNI